MAKVIPLDDVFQEKAVEAGIDRHVKEDSEKLTGELTDYIEKFYQKNSLTYHTIGLVLMGLSYEYELRFLEVIGKLTKVIRKKVKEKNNGDKRE